MMEQDSLKVTSHGSYSFHFAQFSRCTIFKSSQILSSFSSATLLFLHLLSPHSLMTLSLSALWLLVDTQHSCRFSLLSSLFPSFFTPFIISFSPLLAHLIFCVASYCPLHICFHPFLPHIHYLEFASYFQLNIFVPLTITFHHHLFPYVFLPLTFTLTSHLPPQRPLSFVSRAGGNASARLQRDMPAL